MYIYIYTYMERAFLLMEQNAFPFLETFPRMDVSKNDQYQIMTEPGREE